ncbi:MAG: acetyl-coenzyme A synthetase N-terminal domain-containing protein, partial [Candidatus Krumholzibacteriia bacterium]
MDKNLETILNEKRRFEPPEAFREKAHISSLEQYRRQYEESIKDPDGFWGAVAGELHWYEKWRTVLDETDAPYFKWFAGGKTNISVNCLDRHLDGATRNKAAIVWQGEPGEERVLTYRDLWREVNRC